MYTVTIWFHKIYFQTKFKIKTSVVKKYLNLKFEYNINENVKKYYRKYQKESKKSISLTFFINQKVCPALLSKVLSPCILLLTQFIVTH